MEVDNEQRTEQRLSYCWPVHFAGDDEEKTHPGQIVDINSQAIAFLCHADQNCPYPGQPLTISFAVPHFGRNNAFDTVLFNRAGRVSRLDRLSSQVHRVVVQFTESLFFKPSNQDISNSEIQQRLENKALSIIKAEEEAKVYNEALNRAEEKIRFYTEMSVKAEEKAKTAIQAKARAEARAKSETRLRAKAEKKAKAEAELRSRIEAEAQKKARSYADEIAKMKTETAQTLAQIRVETAETIAKIEDELKTKGRAESKISDKTPIKEVVLRKFDQFITDRSKIF